MGIGVALGVVAAIPTGGLSLAGGVLGGAAGGGVIGEFFHKGLKMTDDGYRPDRPRASRRSRSGRRAHLGLRDRRRHRQTRGTGRNAPDPRGRQDDRRGALAPMPRSWSCDCWVDYDTGASACRLPDSGTGCSRHPASGTPAAPERELWRWGSPPSNSRWRGIWSGPVKIRRGDLPSVRHRLS